MPKHELNPTGKAVILIIIYLLTIGSSYSLLGTKILHENCETTKDKECVKRNGDRDFGRVFASALGPITLFIIIGNDITSYFIGE